MRVLVFGGTRFIGRAVTEELAAAGHDVTVVHRGTTMPTGWTDIGHLFCERSEFPARAAQFAALAPDAAVDTIAMTRADAVAGANALPGGVPVVVLSSMDVYAAYQGVLDGRATQSVPFDETAPVRSVRHPYRDRGGAASDYEKLDVEEVYRERGAAICRLPIVFGPHDRQRREEFLLSRIRAGRQRIPFGSGNWLCSRIHARDVATALRAVVETGAAGEVFNIAPVRTVTVREWAETILAAAGSDAELVRVPDDALPDDLAISGALPQHLLADGAKARTVLGWREADQAVRVADSVAWHLAHPPRDSPDFGGDDRALAAAMKTPPQKP
jgi:nucleoside-diphosphate-sugar epimerase